MTTDICTNEVLQMENAQLLSSCLASDVINESGMVASLPVLLESAVTTMRPTSSIPMELGRRLLLAARSGDTDTVLNLMGKGAPFTTDWLGTSPLHLAAMGAHEETCGVLVRAGVCRDARTKVERTPLHLAAYHGHLHVLRVLLDAGADIHARDMLRMSALHWACAQGHGEVAQELVQRGASLAVRDKFNQTPRQLARRHRHLRVLHHIQEALDQLRRQSAEQIKQASSEEYVRKSFDAEGTTEVPSQKQTKYGDSGENPAGTTEEADSNGNLGAEILRRHGITLLPQDEGSTVLNALQSGRTVVLSDAGKLLLKENTETQPQMSPLKNHNKGVLLKATPVKTPLKPGVKIFTLNNKMVTLAKDTTRLSVNKVKGSHDAQVKYIRLPRNTKIISNKMISPAKVIPVKMKSECAVNSAVSVIPSGTISSPADTTARPTFKIVMNKVNFNQIVANNNKTNSPLTKDLIDNNSIASESVEELREQLRQSRELIAQLRAEVCTLRGALERTGGAVGGSGG